MTTRPTIWARDVLHNATDAASVTIGPEKVDSLLWRSASDAWLTKGLQIRDWLLNEARYTRDPDLILAGLCERLNTAGLQVDRSTVVLATLHAEHAATMRVWTSAAGIAAEALSYAAAPQDDYLDSPFFEVHQTRRDLSFRVQETPDSRFGLVSKLRREGYTHYLCMPLFFANGDANGISFATRASDGYSDDNLTMLRLLAPTIEAVLEISAGYMALNQLLRTYIGDEPHELVLNGDVRRGQVTRIRSAILFADMRDYTQRSSTLTPEQTVELLNDYFDSIVPPIEQAGGEVLKYLGDGLLAIFRDYGDHGGGAAEAALEAAQASLTLLAARNAARPHSPIRAGIALHHGEAAYGNVGSGARLDFTVIGRDVNLASRLAGLNKVLGEPLIMSGAFTAQLPTTHKLLGTFPLNGIPDEVTVFRP